MTCWKCPFASRHGTFRRKNSTYGISLSSLRLQDHNRNKSGSLDNCKARQ